MSFVIPELWLKSEVNRLRNKKVRADFTKGGRTYKFGPPYACLCTGTLRAKRLILDQNMSLGRRQLKLRLV